MSASNHFSKLKKEGLRQEVGDFCSAPFCGVQTSVYDITTRKRRLTGDAAHICGAKKGGARYADLPSGWKRDGLDNGIWLCAVCHRMIDNSAELFSVETLLAWKSWAIEAHQGAGRTRRFGITVGADITREHQKAVQFLGEILKVKDLFWHGINWGETDASGSRRYLDTDILDMLWQRAGRYSAPRWNAHHHQWSFLPDLRMWQDEIVRMADTLADMPGIRLYDREEHRLYFLRDEDTGHFTINDNTTRLLAIFAETLKRFEVFLELYSGPQPMVFYGRSAGVQGTLKVEGYSLLNN